MKCPKCLKEGAYFRLRTKDIVCRNCGYVGASVISSAENKKGAKNDPNQ